MRKYIIVIFIIILLTTIGVYQTQSNIIEIESQNKNTEINQTMKPKPPEPEPINPDIQKVQEITNWDLEIATYFVEEANSRNVSIFQEALPLASIETGNTYDFNLINYNTNGTTDRGLFQINDISYIDIVRLLKSEGREFESWNRLNPEFNIAAGICWISHLKDVHQLEEHSLFTSYNRGIYGAKQYASRGGTYESKYSRRVVSIKNELINN